MGGSLQPQSGSGTSPIYPYLSGHGTWRMGEVMMQFFQNPTPWEKAIPLVPCMVSRIIAGKYVLEKYT